MASLTPETIALLSGSRITSSQIILDAKLPRDDYVTIAKACALFDGKWNKKAKAIVFDKGTADLCKALAGDSFVDVKKDLGFFPTPPRLAEDMVRRADVRIHHLCLEPSCGPGQIVSALSDVRPGWIDCVDIHAPHIAALLNARHPNGSLRRFTALCADFLTLPPEPIYDRIVMNPPFSAPGIRAVDATHIMHAWHFLKPGGRLVAIASAGLSFRTDTMTATVRDAAETFGTILPNPEGTFSPSGTDVQTVLVTMNKPHA